MTLQSAYARLRLFRQSFEDGAEICEESGLTADDLDLILSVNELQRYAKCGGCGQSFDLQDPEQVAYHDQERHDPR